MSKRDGVFITIIMAELAVIIVLFINGIFGDRQTLTIATALTTLTLLFWAWRLYRKRYEISVAAAEAALMGLLGNNRVEAISRMKKTLPDDLSEQETADLLQGLLGTERVRAIEVLVKARKLHHEINASEASLILSGLLGQDRVDAIALLARGR